MTFSDISGVFLGRLVHTLKFQIGHHDWHWVGKISKFVPSDALKMLYWACLFLDFLLKYFPNYLVYITKRYSQFIWVVFKKFMFKQKNCMAINLWKVQTDLSWNDATSSIEIIRSSVNYLVHLMNGSRFVKISTR